MAVKPDSKGVVTGTKNADKITFGTSPEWQKALTVNAGAGADTIDFKKSKYKNTLNGEAGNDTIYGGTNIDIIKGGLGTDLIYGYNGKDELYGDAGKDTIYGGNGDDYLNGGADNDKLYGDAGTDTIMGGDGNDSLYGGDGIDSVVGGNGNDYIEGGAGFGRLFGLTGNDTIKGGKDKDTIDGGDGNDLLYGGGDNDTIKGNKGNDILYGEDGNDYLYGMNDNDTLYGGVGNDLLDGGPGNDSLIGGDGNDTVRAGADDDYVDSGNGDDFIQGHGGKDTLKGGNGNDTIEGNDGDDLIYGDSGNDLLRGGNGNDTIYAGSGNDTIDIGSGNDKVFIQNADCTILSGTDNNEDTISFVNVESIDDLTVKLGETNSMTESDAVISYIVGSNTYEVTVTDYKNKTNKVIQIQTNNGETVSLNDLINPEYNATPAAQSILNGTIFGDNIVADYDNKNIRATIQGGDGNDTIAVVNANPYYSSLSGKYVVSSSTINGGAGADVIYGGKSNDYILGGSENDLIYGNEAKDNIFGGDGDDTIFGGTHNDSIDGGAGVDVLYGDEGNDYIKGGIGNDTIFGGAGSDSILGDSDNDIIYGYLGISTFDSVNGFNYIEAVNEADRIETLPGVVDTINGGLGDDTIYAGATKNVFEGGAGNDVIYGYSGGGNTFQIFNASETSNDGEDIIYTGYGDNANADTIKFRRLTNINDLSLNLSFNGVDAILTYGEAGKITLKNFLKTANSPGGGINATTIWLEDRNGNKIRLTDLYKQSNYTSTGTVFSDGLSVNENSAPVNCGLGNDTVLAQDGCTVIGGEGANVYMVFPDVLDNATKVTTITSTSGKDVIEFNKITGSLKFVIITPTDYSFSKEGSNDLGITYTRPSGLIGIIHLKDYFINPVEITLRTADGDLSLIDMLEEAPYITGSGAKFGSGEYNAGTFPIRVGSNGDDSITCTGSGNPKVYGNDGDDVITVNSTSGTNYLYGGKGVDKITGGTNGNNYIYGTGKDKGEVVSTSDTDTLIGGDKDDWFYVYGENASIEGGKGNDYYYSYLTNKVIIKDTEGKDNIIITNPDSQSPLGINDIHFGIDGSLTYDNGNFSIGGNGKLFIFDNENYQKWLNGVENSSLARIEIDRTTLQKELWTEGSGVKISLDSNSNIYLDKTEMREILADIAAWYSTNYNSYASVEKIISAHNDGSIDASQFIAMFNDFTLINHS